MRTIGLALGMAVGVLQAPSTAFSQEADGLCQRDERAFFHCRVARSGKVGALCGSRSLTAEAGYLQYRFGRPAKVELEFPPLRSRTQRQFRYRRVSVGRNDSGEWRIGFESQGAVYEAFYDGTIDRERAGILVYRRGRDGGLTQRARLDCTSPDGAWDLRDLGAAIPHALGSLDDDEPGPPVVERGDLLTWPRVSSVEFGCFLERQLGHKDRQFHCARRAPVRPGDPCKSPKLYAAGPGFPAAKVGQIHPDVTAIDLSWERGALQQVTLTLATKMTDRAARERLRLPAAGDPLPQNVQRIDVEECSAHASCVTLTGFEHLGAGDLDCGAAP